MEGKMKEVILENVSKSYGTGVKKQEVLKGVNLEVETGEFVTIYGPSGAGKTTIMNIVGGLDDFDAGEVIVNGENISNLSETKLARYRRRHVGYIFQMFHLIPVLTVYENIVYPLLLDKSKIDDEYVEELMKDLGILEKRSAFPNELSGGQQQRVAIARALVNQPNVILADEPTGNLDEKTGNAVIDLLLSRVKKYHRTLILITHNMEIARRSDRIYQLREGKLYEISVDV